MKVNELSGLYVVENKKENFKILVAALDEQEVMEIARDYFMDSHMEQPVYRVTLTTVYYFHPRYVVAVDQQTGTVLSVERSA